MNNINQKQNEEKFLKYLFAQRYLYSNTKSKYSISLIISIIIIIAGIIPYISKNHAIPLAIVSFIGLVFSYIVDIINNNKRKLAVDFQEYVDRSLFEFKIDKNVISNLNKLDDIANEFIITNRQQYEEQINPNNEHGIYNWYTNVSSLPLDIARVVCQNENVRWENRQRGLYSKIILGIIISIIVGYSSKLYFLNESWINIICICPIIFEVGKVLFANYNVTKSINKAQEIIGDLYINIEQKKDKYNKKNFKEKSLEIQQYINQYRQNNISIPDYIYNKMKLNEQLKSTEFIGMRVKSILENI